MEVKEIAHSHNKRKSAAQSLDKKSTLTAVTGLAKKRAKQSKAKKDKMEQDSGTVSGTETEETPVAESVFSNYLVLRKIFNSTTFQDLKSCREVNRLWNLEATPILLKKFPMQSIVLSNGTVKFFEAWESSQKIRDPLEFNLFHNLVSNSSIFPCSNFTLNDPPTSNSNNLFEFFLQNGSIVKSLVFRPTCVDELILLASKHLPNLETLTIFTGYQKARIETPSNLEESMELKKLHTLKLRSDFDTEVLSSLLKVGVNLKKIYFNDENRLDAYYRGLWSFLNLNAIPRLSNIQLSFEKYSLDLLATVVEKNPIFERIDDINVDELFKPHYLPKVGKLLTEVLEQQRESLTSISGVRFLGHVPNLKIPVLPNVTKFAVDYSELKQMRRQQTVIATLFPPDVNIAQILPNLKQFKMFLGEIENFEVKQIFPDSSTPLETVKNLELIAGCPSGIPSFAISEVCKLFPNVTCAKIGSIEESAFELIFQLRFLTSLQLTLSSGIAIQSFPTMDSVFTGFSEKTVRRLYRKKPGDLNLSAEEVEDWRIKPSIVDLKELRELTIIWNDYSRCFRSSEEKPTASLVPFGTDKSGDFLKEGERIVLTHVTKLFGFDMCSQLKSNVIIKKSQIRPFDMPRYRYE